MKDENIAKAVGRSLPISTKHSVEICNFIRGKNLQKSKTILKEVVKEKRAVPFKRFKRDVGHKTGKIASGRFPKKASQHIIKLLDSVEVNAQNKGLNVDLLFVKNIKANKASTPWRFGRLRRRKMKRTHIEVIVEEKESKEEKKK